MVWQMRLVSSMRASPLLRRPVLQGLSRPIASSGMFDFPPFWWFLFWFLFPDECPVGIWCDWVSGPSFDRAPGANNRPSPRYPYGCSRSRDTGVGGIVRVVLFYLCVAYVFFCETSFVCLYIYAKESLISRVNHHFIEEAIADTL